MVKVMNDKNKKQESMQKDPPPTFSWKAWLILFFFFLITYLSIFFQDRANMSVFEIFILSIFVSTFASTFLYGIYYLFKKYFYMSELKSSDIEQLKSQTEHLQEILDEDFFTNLVKINFKYIDKYYYQTQVQANKSFWLSVAASIIGFCIIITGIVLMFFDKTNPSYVTTATGVLTEAIAAIFFYLYNKTIMKMSAYHQKLVLTQNISLALKISQELPDDSRVNSQMALINSLTSDVNKYLVNTDIK